MNQVPTSQGLAACLEWGRDRNTNTPGERIGKKGKRGDNARVILTT
jgi:hypothetical protein